MPWFPSTFRIMTSLFDHDLAPRVCQKKHGRSFRQETRWDREARPCRVPSMQGSWPHNRSVGAPSDGDIDGRSLQIEGAITWGLARGTARRRGQLRGADAGALARADPAADVIRSYHAPLSPHPERLTTIKTR